MIFIVQYMKLLIKTGKIPVLFVIDKSYNQTSVKDIIHMIAISAIVISI